MRIKCYHVWDFDVVLPNTSTVQPPQLPEKETLGVAPLLDVNRLTTSCNCQTYPETSAIICKESDELDSEETEEEIDGTISMYFHSVCSLSNM